MIDVSTVLTEKPRKELEPFVHEFLADRMTDWSEMSRYLSAGDLQFLANTAHKWKGYSRPYGFVLLESFAKQLEQAALENNVRQCESTLAGIKEYLNLKKSVYRQ